MREPTTLAEKWAWWEAVTAGEPPPFNPREDEPQAGFYRIRKFPYGAFPKGPWLPARIWWNGGEIDLGTGELMTDEICCCEIDGQRKDPWRVWTWLMTNPITHAEFKWLKAMSPLTPKRIPLKSR